ncbi:MAG: VWA domain-containing protein [Bdellovibrionales bacterium]|nr:VWA domain-containing protein [Bdellovibrionales bacterium]
MRFATPQALLLLLLIPVFFFYWLQSSRTPFIRMHFQHRKNSGRFFDPSFISTILKAIGLACLIFALARPQAISRSQERKANGIDIVMVLDVSLSMLIQDMGDKNRMEIAKQTFKTFIEGRKSDRIGFIIFSGEPLTLAPPTLDYGLLMSQLQTVEPGGNGLRDGTAIGDGLALAVNRLKKSTAKSRVIILLTDGDSNVGRIDPLTAGELAKGYGIRTYSVAIGTEGRVRQPFPQQTPLGTTYTYVWVENKLNTSLLQQISEKTDGRFYRVQDEKALYDVFKSIDKLEKNEVTTRDKVRYDEGFIPYLIVAFCCLALERLLSVIIWRQWA